MAFSSSWHQRNAYRLMRGKVHHFIVQTHKMNITLLEAAKQCPEMTVSIKLGELVEAARTIVAETIQAEAAAAPKDDEVYLSRNEVMEIFGVSSTTLWRWSRDYLVPEKIGNSVRYRMSDIQKRMEESKHVNG